MSSFSNGGYVTQGMDFSDWGECLNEKMSAERDAEIEKDFEEFYSDFFASEPEEEEYKLSIPEEALPLLKNKADSLITDVKKSLEGISKSVKCELLKEMQRQTHDRLLFDFIRDNPDEEIAFIVRNPSKSFLEEERKAQTYQSVQTILNTAFYDPDNKTLSSALKQFDSVLKNEPWAKSHAEHVDKWLNSKAGNQATVLTKLLDAKLKVLSESIAQEPEQTKKKFHKRDYDMER